MCLRDLCVLVCIQIIYVCLCVCLYHLLGICAPWMCLCVRVQAAYSGLQTARSTPRSLAPLNGGQPLEDSWNQAVGMAAQPGTTGPQGSPILPGTFPTPQLLRRYQTCPCMGLPHSCVIGVVMTSCDITERLPNLPRGAAALASPMAASREDSCYGIWSSLGGWGAVGLVQTAQ